MVAEMLLSCLGGETQVHKVLNFLPQSDLRLAFKFLVVFLKHSFA